MRLKVSCVFSVALIAGSLNGQDDPEERVRLGKIVTKKVTVLKSHPQGGATVIQTIPKGAELRWVEGQKNGGFFRVAPDKGPIGWIPAEAVDSGAVVNPPPAPPAGSITEAAAACVGSLSDCTIDGCGTAGTPQGMLNEAKRHFVTDTPVTVTFADLSALQTAADQALGQHHDIADRSALQNLVETLGEGSAVQLVAFLAKLPAGNSAGPHPNNGESVNCGLKGADNNDFHIPVTEGKNQTDSGGVVVEMIPQGPTEGDPRNAGWTLAKLAKLRTSQKQVKIVGQLFYDNMHFVNSDPGNPLGGQPRRMALWEIHPVSGFFACKKTTNNCNIETDSDWTPLENLP